jgi:N-acylneuraminate cytidylyltransferase
MENGAFYMTRRDILHRYKCRLGGKVGIYEMDESTAVEIDEPEDWERVERLLLERKAR